MQLVLASKKIIGDNQFLKNLASYKYRDEVRVLENIPNDVKGKFNDWVFGCDICQDVCPWNKFSTPHSEVNFLPKEELLNLSSEDWHALTEEKFTDLFESSAVKRTGFNGLSRNLSFIKTEFK